MSDFGAFLKEKRISAGLSQKQLSEKCFHQTPQSLRVDPSLLSRWETGDSHPLLQHRPILVDIGKALQMPASEINAFLTKAGFSTIQAEDTDSVSSGQIPKDNTNGSNAVVKDVKNPLDSLANEGPIEVSPSLREQYQKVMLLMGLPEKTQHKPQMRKMARAIAEEISLPFYGDKNLWSELPVEFQAGTYPLQIGLVEIDENKQIKVNYCCIGAGIAEPHLVKGLYSHLSTSGLPKFAELVGKNGKLNDLVDEAEQYSHELLTFLKFIADEVKEYRAKVDFHDKGNPKPGLTKWFIITVWRDALEKAGGYLGINNSWYKPYENISNTNLWQLRCGAYPIAIARSQRTLAMYENWHKRIRIKYGKHPLAKGIHDKSQELNNNCQDIRRILREFSDTQYLPGRCELC